MKLLGILRFELAYQMRRPWPWLCLLVLVVFAFVNTRVAVVPVTLPQDFILNSPFIIAVVTMISCQIWLLMAPAIAGEAAARDVHTGMHSLIYATPISRTEYLGGRFLAAVVVNAVILFGVQVGSLLAAHAPGVNPDIIGPFRPAAYLAAFGLLALPNICIATAMQFSAALLSGRPMASYLGSLILFFLTYPVTFVLYLSGLGERALMADPIGIMAIMNQMMSKWTIIEKNVRMFTLQGPMLWNRLLWLAIALVTLAFVYLRFRFAHRTAADWWSWLARALGRLKARRSSRTAARQESGTTVPFVGRVRQSFGFGMQVRQTLSIAWSSFRMIGRSPAGLFLLVAYPAFVVLVLLVETEHWGIPLLPRTGYMLAEHITAPLTHFADFRVMVPLLIIYFASELVWRERDARLSDTIDAAPVAEWVLFLGKLLGLAIVLAALMASLTAAAMLTQTIRGYRAFELNLYLRILLGLQLPQYLLFAVLALAVQSVVNRKYLGLMAALAVYLAIVFAGLVGFRHNLLVYGSGPEWSFTDIRGFGPTLAPWLWFKLYWAGWALLVAVTATLLWARGREAALGTRLRIACRRFTAAAVAPSVLAMGLILGIGSFIFYNTNVLNEYITEDELVERRAAYERRYGKYEGIPQPQPAATNLHVEIYPERGAATVRGSYRLVNRDTVAINAVHVEPAFYVETDVTFDRPAKVTVADAKLGHFIYTLDEPLQPGDSLMLNFEVRLQPRGFRNSGAAMQIVRNGSHFKSGALPVIGYQPRRELSSAEDRRKHGLPRQVTLAMVADVAPDVAATPAATFEAIIGTAGDQVAVAPGELRRTWREAGRRYFHYGSDVPISGEEVFFSAAYAVHRERWKHVDIQVFLHPAHTKHLDRFLRSVRASLEYYSAQFGPYPYRFLQIVEQPGNFRGMGVDGSGVVTAGEGIFLFNPEGDGFDAIFEIVAHEMGHQWWGMQLKPAFAEGGGVISESLAWYSAMQLVKNVKGREALRRFMSFMREPNPWPPIRTGLPLLRAMDPWANYRKGPYAFHALSEYIGEDRVNAALRSLLEKKATSLATSLDLYRELQAVAPDSARSLLHDLFEANIIWMFDTKHATAVQTEAGSWEVTLDVEARKVATDSAGVDMELPVDEWVEIGVFAAAGPGEVLGQPLYVEKHRIRSGPQTIMVTVPHRPARGGIDPYNLLDWEEGDNIEPIKLGTGTR